MESKQPGNQGVPAGGVDVWSVRLDKPARAGSEVGVLSPDEVARASRFHFEKDRIHFTQCRSALRDLLAGYLAIPAAEIRFEYLASGKPQLARAQNPSGLRSKVSNTTCLAVI